MADFMHYEVNAGPANTIEVEVDRQANVLLMDHSNFSAYRSRRRYRYRGGLVRQSPVHLTPPHSGTWHVVIDLGGARGYLNTAQRVSRERMMISSLLQAARTATTMSGMARYITICLFAVFGFLACSSSGRTGATEAEPLKLCNGSDGKTCNGPCPTGQSCSSTTTMNCVCKKDK